MCARLVTINCKMCHCASSFGMRGSRAHVLPSAAAPPPAPRGGRFALSPPARDCGRAGIPGAPQLGETRAVANMSRTHSFSELAQ